ncbi:MAG TPA: hypothetical protein VFL76_03795 [Edaphocola sp.]|nr:hypothetical protein [Edaphocola sp.]
MKKSTLKLWGIPFLMAVILLYGLISALARDGFGDVIACVILCIPILTVICKYYFGTMPERR